MYVCNLGQDMELYQDLDFSSIKHIKLLTHKGTVQFNILFLFFPLGEGSVPNIKLWDFPADKC